MKRIIANVLLAATLVTSLFGTVAAPKAAVTAEAAGTKVIVLDPGHDDTHIGARYGDYLEERLTLKIAAYCKQQLEGYGYKVYVTRDSNSCAFGGTSISTAECLRQRYTYASKVNADYFVSIHLNASSSADAKGTEVYYSAQAKSTSKSAKLAKSILTQLTSLGLTNRGVKSANYAVLNGANAAKIPGVLIEHCFMSNASDQETYLSSESGLKALAVADAKGIDNYVSKQTDDDAEDVEIITTLNSATPIGSFNTVKLKWTGSSAASGYYVYRKTDSTNWKKVGETTKTAFNDITGQVNRTYTYCVAGYNSYGTGQMSNTLSAKTAKGIVTSLEVKTADFNGTYLKWSKVGGADAYKVYRRGYVSGVWSSWKAVEIVEDGTTYEDETTRCDRKYQYYVKALRYDPNDNNKYVGGKRSPIVDVTTAKANTEITNIEKRSNASAKIFWKEVPGATAYRIYRKPVSGGDWETIMDGTTKTAYVDKTAQPLTEYYYAVRPFKEVGEEVIWSKSKSEKVKFTTGYGAKKKVTQDSDDEDEEEDDEEDEAEEDASTSSSGVNYMIY